MAWNYPTSLPADLKAQLQQADVYDEWGGVVDWGTYDKLVKEYYAAKEKEKSKEEYPTPEDFTPGPTTGGVGTTGSAGTGGAAGDAANWFQYFMGEYPTPTEGKYAETTKYKLPPFFQVTEPQMLGTSWLAAILQNPYAMPDYMLQETLAGGEKAYQRAKGTIDAGLRASGAEEGGVAKGVGGQVDLAHAASTADAIRNWQQFMLQTGDKRLQALFLPYMNIWNQAFAIAEGQPPPDQSSIAEDIFSAVAQAAPLIAMAV